MEWKREQTIRRIKADDAARDAERKDKGGQQKGGLFG